MPRRLNKILPQGPSKVPSAEEVVQARTAIGYSQADCAKAISVSVRQWQNYEDGTSNMHPLFWRNFCNVLNLEA